MLTIGRFTDATGVTAEALRHYGEIGLPVPARVDPDNGYRYNDSAQIDYQEHARTVWPLTAGDDAGVSG